MFAPLFCQERQPVSSVFHIPTGFMHSSARDGGQHGFSTVKQSVQHKYIDSLPQCGRGKLCLEPVPPTKLIPNADLFKQHFNGYILFIHYSTSLLKIYHSVFHIPQRFKIIYFLMGPGDHPQTMILVGLRALGMGPIIDVCARWKF